MVYVLTYRQAFKVAMKTYEARTSSPMAPVGLDDPQLFETQAGFAAVLRSARQSNVAVPESLIPDSESGIEVGSSTRRLDPISGCWTIFSSGRAARPMDFAVSIEKANNTASCPFCFGSEDRTPPEVWKSLGEKGWAVRVVPNKFPAVSQSGDEESVSARVLDRGPTLFQSHPIVGGHEVVIESPEHIRSVTELNLDHFIQTFVAYRDRIRHWSMMDGIGNVSVFKNVGPEAGASLSHSHSQVVATDYVPDDIAIAMRNQAKHRARTGACLQCDLIRQEVRDGTRVLFLTEEMIAFCPYASPHAGMIRISSRSHRSSLIHLDNFELGATAQMVWQSICRMEKTLGKVAYNYVLNVRPPGLADASDAFHWSIDIIPRTSKIAGFEWNTGMMINSSLPEVAASSYRAVRSV